MSMQLQIAIPALVCFAALIGIAIWKKYFKLETVIMSAVALGIGLTMLITHISGTIDTNSLEQSEDQNHRISLMLAEQFMLAEHYDDAMNILEDLQIADADNPEVKVALARCSLLNGNYTAAVTFYNQVSDVENDEKSAAVALSSRESNGVNAIAAYLKEHGKSASNYNLTVSPLGIADYEEAKALVLDKVQEHIAAHEEEGDYDLAEATEAAANISALFDRYVDADTAYMEDEEKAAIQKLDALMEESSPFVRNVHMRVARMKGFILTGDYAKIAGAADRYTSTQELVVLTELYTNGVVDKSDFADSYADLDERCYDVLELCRDALEQGGDSLAKYQREKYQQKIDRMDQQLKDPIEFTLRYDLLNAAQNGRYSLRSKSYLALSKIEKFNGNDDQANSYLNEAIGTAGESNDENYRVPMGQLAGIIQGTADSEEVKKVAQYVDQAMDHSLPIGIEASRIEVSEQPEESPDADENADGAVNYREEYVEYVEDAVNTTAARLNIGAIKKGEFPNDPTVTARIQIQSNKWTTIEELREHLRVYDCGSEITNFTLEKIDFQTSRIVLLCDVSGSMSGSEQDLKDAIISFAEEMAPGEEVSVVGFESDITFIEPFSGDPETVKGYADRIVTGGGTAIYSSLIKTIDSFVHDINANNIIIAMTDGQDGSHANEGQLYNELGAKVADKAITVYTLGLGGGVETVYLKQIAQFGNGSFLYADTKEKLETFYDFIHGQLANQYVLTYTAKNTTLNERRLEIMLDDEPGRAEKVYFLVDKVYTEEGSESYDAYTPQDSELTIRGFNTKFLYKSSGDQVVYLKGQGFDAGDTVTVRLMGNVNYTMTTKFIDANTYEVVIPSQMATGVYDLEVAIRDESVTLENELTIAVHGTEKNFRFGSYNFTALSSYVNEQGQTVLSGNVTLNGWLHFKGDILIDAGYQNSAKAWITDDNGSYITYSESVSQGLSKAFAEWGMPVPVQPLGRFSISSDLYNPDKYQEFPVNSVNVHVGLDLEFMDVSSGKVCLYPDMFTVTPLDFQFGFPLQEQVMRNLKSNLTAKVEVDSDILLTATNIAFVGKAKWDDDENGVPFTLVSLPLTLSGLEANIDTLNHEYKLEGTVKFKALGNGMDGLTLGIGILKGKLDSVKLQTKGTDSVLLQSPIPISMADFGVEIEGLSKYKDDKSILENLLSNPINVLFEVNVASLNAYAPDIAELISDKSVALASLSNCTLSMEFKEFRFAFDADIVFCTILDMGKCSIKLGKFEYTNALIGYYDETQYGLQVSVTRNLLDWNTPNVNLDLKGTTEITLGYPYTGIWFNGTADFDVKYWIFKKDFDVSGDALIGCYKNSSDNFQFSIIVRGTNARGNYAGFHLYITKARGLRVDSY